MELPLSKLSVGKTGKIIRLEGGPGLQRNLRLRGIAEGNYLKVIASHPLGGPVVVEIKGRGVTIGKGMATRVIIEVI